MRDHWEFILLGVVGCIGLVYVIAYEWLLWRGTRHWLRTHFPAQYHRSPIYGPADPYRTKGPHSKPNLRRV